MAKNEWKKWHHLHVTISLNLGTPNVLARWLNDPGVNWSAMADCKN